MSPEEKALLNYHLTESARILYKSTEEENLEDFEKIEIVLREQLLETVGPTIGEFFFLREEHNAQETSAKSEP
jgi:hypothetical protein